MVLQLLVRDCHHHLTLLPSSSDHQDDDIISITKPLHLTLPTLSHPHITVNTIAASHAAGASSASSCSSPSPSIPSLPLDTLLLVTSFLPPASLCVLTSVSSAFLSVFLHPSHWKQLADSLGYRRNFPLERTAQRSFVLTQHSALCLAQATFHHMTLFLSPLLLSTLRAALPLAALHRYEQRVSCIFPSHLRAALLVHDGQDEDGAVGSGWVEGCRLLSGQEIVEEWESRRRREREEGDAERGEGSLHLLAVTSVSGVNRFLLSVSDGSVWMETGRLRRRQQVSDQWLHLIAGLLPQRWSAQQLTHYTAVHWA
jgi:hypothetical protein